VTRAIQPAEQVPRCLLCGDREQPLIEVTIRNRIIVGQACPDCIDLARLAAGLIQRVQKARK